MARMEEEERLFSALRESGLHGGFVHVPRGFDPFTDHGVCHGRDAGRDAGGDACGDDDFIDDSSSRRSSIDDLDGDCCVSVQPAASPEPAVCCGGGSGALNLSLGISAALALVALLSRTSASLLGAASMSFSLAENGDDGDAASSSSIVHTPSISVNCSTAGDHYTVGECGVYDSGSCAAYCTNSTTSNGTFTDEASWCNSLCGDACDEGDGALCTATVLTNITEVCAEYFGSPFGSVYLTDADDQVGVTSEATDCDNGAHAHAHTHAYTRPNDRLAPRAVDCGLAPSAFPRSRRSSFFRTRSRTAPPRRRAVACVNPSPTTPRAADAVASSPSRRRLAPSVRARRRCAEVYCAFCGDACQAIIATYSAYLNTIGDWGDVPMGTGPLTMYIVDNLPDVCAGAPPLGVIAAAAARKLR
jgi:hypothetical protein